MIYREWFKLDGNAHLENVLYIIDMARIGALMLIMYSLKGIMYYGPLFTTLYHVVKNVREYEKEINEVEEHPMHQRGILNAFGSFRRSIRDRQREMVPRVPAVTRIRRVVQPREFRRTTIRGITLTEIPNINDIYPETSLSDRSGQSADTQNSEGVLGIASGNRRHDPVIYNASLDSDPDHEQIYENHDIWEIYQAEKHLSTRTSPSATTSTAPSCPIIVVVDVDAVPETSEHLIKPPQQFAY